MCGIVGYIGYREAFPIVIKGLKRLEYRGYDSAGVMLYDGTEMKLAKTKGKVSDLEEKAKDISTNGTIGMGHTRWATHGVPNDVNSHPHLSNSGDLAIIHNGIIENYAPLKEELIKRGYVFHSDTDSEVLVNLIEEIQQRCELDERVLVTTLTKRMAEELAKYLTKVSIRCRYIHSDVDTLERIEIMQDLRKGLFDVLIGVNLLREGLDLPEVSLVAILDADKEGFLRSHRSLTQTIGRAARNLNGKAIMYADKITASMQKTIDETLRRREKQIKYNIKHNITPTTVSKSTEQIMAQGSVLDVKGYDPSKAYALNNDATLSIAAEDEEEYLTIPKMEKKISSTKRQMEKAAKDLDFMEAAKLRDEMFRLKKVLEEMK